MTHRLIGGSVRFRVLVVAAAASLMVLGIVRLHHAPVDVLPEYTLPYVEVQTESLGLAAAEVEQFITVPLEQDLLNGVKGVETIRSDSVPGLSTITMVFARGTDILRARQLVQERLAQPHAFPSVSKPPQMLQPVSSTNRVMMIGLSSSRLSPIELSVLARWTIRPRLVGISGVANVAIWGHRDRQLQVLVDPRRLRAHGVSLLKVIETTGNAQLVSSLSFLDASTPGTGGFIDGPNQRLGVRHVLPFGKPADLAQVPIEEGTTRLGDVATVVEDHQPLIGDAVVGRGGGSGLLLVVEKLPHANTLAVTRRLDEALGELGQGLPGVQIDASVYRPVTYIDRAMHDLGWLLAIGGGLMLAALAVSLARWRAVLTAVAAIVLSLVAAALVLVAAGTSLNALVIAGLVAAVAVVVDDAVGDPSPEARGAMGYATLVVLLSVVPVLLVGGLTGAFVRPMAYAYAGAVLASAAVALTLSPALGRMLSGAGQGRRRRSSPLAVLADPYERLLLRSVHTPRPALLVLGGLVVAGAVSLLLLGGGSSGLRPSFQDRQLLVHWEATPSTSLPEMRRITARAVRELRTTPGVRDVGAHVGRAVTADQTVGTGSGELWVTMQPGAAYGATVASIRRVVMGYPGVRGRVLTAESERSQGVFAPADDGLTVRLYGQELGVLRARAAELRRVLAGVDGVRDPQVLVPEMQPTMQVEVDLARAQRHGIKPGDVRRAVATLVSGLEVGSFFEQQKVFSAVVRGVPSTRHSLDSVRSLLIDTPPGGHVRLGDVARVQIRPNPVDIRHDAVSRYVDVRAGVSGRDVAAVRADARRRLRDIALPLEYHAEVLSPPPDAGSAQSLWVTALAASIGILLLLQAAFGRWRLAALVLVTLPAALVGGLVMMLAGGGDLSLGGLGGLFALLAIAARQGIALVLGFERLEREGEPFGPGLVVRGTRQRLVPVATTAVVTVAALLPLAVAGGMAGNEITQPLAVVVLGGLVTTTLVGLLVLPAAYLHFARAAARAPAPAERPGASVPELGSHA
jgi:Cu/Ag efflux pump CusA